MVLVLVCVCVCLYVKSNLQARHAHVCAKMNQNARKRKPFDTARHRMMGTDMEQLNSRFRRPPSQAQPKKSKHPPQQVATQEKSPSWRQKHEELIQSIRAARSIAQAMASGEQQKRLWMKCNEFEKKSIICGFMGWDKNILAEMI